MADKWCSAIHFFMVLQSFAGRQRDLSVGKIEVTFGGGFVRVPRMKKYLLLLLLLIWLAPSASLADDEEAPLAHGAYEGDVTKIADGNSIDVDGERFHLLGVDAPRSSKCPKVINCSNEEAKKFLEDNVMGRTITYDYDRMLGRRDRHGDRRIYLYVEGELINATLIEKGLGFADRSRDFSKKDLFLGMEDLARRRSMGLWHLCPVECTGNRACRTKNW